MRWSNSKRKWLGLLTVALTLTFVSRVSANVAPLPFIPRRPDLERPKPPPRGIIIPAVFTPTTNPFSPTPSPTPTPSPFPSSCSYSNDVLNSHPLVYYRMNETGGTVMVDSSGNGRDGTWNGSPQLGQTSCPITSDPNNKCASFSEATRGDFGVYIPTIYALGDTTVEYWYNLTSPGYMINSRFPDDFSLDLSFGNGDLGNGSTWIASLTCSGHQNNTWMHIMWVFTGINWKGYRNGQLCGSGSYSSTVPLVFDPNHYFSIGGFGHYTGGLDEVAVYWNPLSQADADRHYRLGIGTYPCGLTPTPTGTITGTPTRSPTPSPSPSPLIGLWCCQQDTPFICGPPQAGFNCGDKTPVQNAVCNGSTGACETVTPTATITPFRSVTPTGTVTKTNTIAPTWTPGVPATFTPTRPTGTPTPIPTGTAPSPTPKFTVGIPVKHCCCEDSQG